jgi:hypothetical protein
MIGDQNVTASGVIGYLSLSTASACPHSSIQILTDPIIRNYSRATSVISLRPRRSLWKLSNSVSTARVSTTQRRRVVVAPPMMIQPYCAFTTRVPLLDLLISKAGTADSSVPGSLMSVKHTNSLRIPPVGGRNTMSKTYIQHLTLMRWSRRRDSTLGGLVGETR